MTFSRNATMWRRFAEHLHPHRLSNRRAADGAPRKPRPEIQKNRDKTGNITGTTNAVKMPFSPMPSPAKAPISSLT
ncbi:hypothetical protein BSFA1_61750 (plasmid) [Burkholderia sp. SFA1]|nr:hypothetical protein BSFA1_61750 [Burkholderia sp. SFA1]